ncbi:hypothetical protein C0216_12025 [Streptomyces globosus]|uniref:HTH merR-type domain-containing protein n=1 Tax=Streptomyces globosus TaxID=68209 RepID=A0A344TZL5_9ACTN|nr:MULTISPECIES: MerR family transcriptional regulator [Streptomyces]AXE24086.1 hypothetical protein C0216_12025 [Streptomyces globosus]
MRVAALSAVSGVPVSTIDHYICEGLLPGPDDEAAEDAGQVRRLALIRALVEVGGHSLHEVRDIVGAIEAAEADPAARRTAEYGRLPADIPPGELLADALRIALGRLARRAAAGGPAN